jgi:hypothetical protein
MSTKRGKKRIFTLTTVVKVVQLNANASLNLVCGVDPNGSPAIIIQLGSAFPASISNPPNVILNAENINRKDRKTDVNDAVKVQWM